MTVKYHHDLIQGSTAWLEARLGLITASEMKFILTPTLKLAKNDKERAQLFNLLAQRIAGYVEPGYTGDDMYRGHEDELDARLAYAANYAPVEDCGFITNDRWGFTLGYSPDGLVGSDGLIEIKSRKHRFQVETILDSIGQNTAPAEFMLQLQTGLLVSERKWIDFISYSAGLPMATVRILPDPAVQTAIIEAAAAFEARLSERLDQFTTILKSDARLLATERRLDREITF
jgi:hypothetical protein